MKPYKILEKTSEYEIREFKDFEPSNLFWHRDKEDRLVQLIQGSIEMQLDNELPVKINKTDLFKIKKMQYHRVIATDYFKIKIYFI